LILFLGVLNTSTGNNISNLSTVSKTSPSTTKNTQKDQKLFTTAKPIDPAWLAQTKMETANIVNANKLLVRDPYKISLGHANTSLFCISRALFTKFFAFIL
jgi:hypothetical protein